jgi:DNA-binding MarR family transcriptional regulator
MPISPPAQRELQILEHIETNPDATQADLADELGVAIGTVNFAIRRLISRGYIRAKQLQRRRLKYIITPAGIALRSKLALDSLHYSMGLYREIRRQAKELILEARQKGYGAIAIGDDGDLAEIARLTCLELAMPIKTAGARVPRIVTCGTMLRLDEPAAEDRLSERLP